MSDTQTTHPDPPTLPDDPDTFLRSRALGGIILPTVNRDGRYCSEIMPGSLYRCGRLRGHTGWHHHQWIFYGVLRHVWGQR